MEVFNGSDLVLVIETSAGNYKPIAGARQFTLSVNRTIRDVSHKHVGAAQKNEYGRYNWSVSIEGLISYYADYVNHDWFLTQQLAKNKIKIITSLLDYQTAGKAPLAQDTALPIQDSDDAGLIDDATTTIETTGDYFAANSVITTLTPKANYGQAVIESVEKTGGDDDNPTFSVSLKGTGYIRSFDVSASSGFGAEYLAVYNAMTNKPSGSVATAQNTMVEALKTANRWADYDVFYVWAERDDAYESLINWKNPGTYDCTLSVIEPAHVDYEGYTGNATNSRHIITNWNPTTHGVNYILNDASIGVYIRTDVDGNMYDVGIDDGSNDVWINPRNTNQLSARINDATSLFITNSDSSGMYVISRTGAAARACYKNGSSIGSDTAASTALPNRVLTFLGRMALSVGGISTRQDAIGYAGASCDATKAAAENAAIEAYMDSNGKGVQT